MSQQLCSLIDGEWIAGDGEPITSVDPAHPGDVVATGAEVSAGQLDRAVEAALAAQAGWDRLGLVARGRVLRRAAELVADRAEDLTTLMTREEGKPLADARGEVDATAETLHYHAGAARRPVGLTYPSGRADEEIRTVRRPVGVVGVVTPWNFPLQIPAWKMAPALLWGNAVVWKPAPDTPAMAVAFAEILEAAGVPGGVLNLVLGGSGPGSALVADPRVAAVTFTGSVATGASIRDAVVPRGGRLQMELGGHNAAIVLPDADPAAAAEAIVAAAMNSTGQKCTATRRVIAVGEAYDALLPQLRTRVESLRVGPGLDPDTEVGPLVSATARRRVEEAIETALAEGATVLARAGGVPDADVGAGDDHCYVVPTLLAGEPSLTIAREEVFGPVTTLLRAGDLAEAIRLANATGYGLTASVFTHDERAVRRCIDDLHAGLVKVNAPSTGSEVHAPFGGMLASSFPAPKEQASDEVAEFFTVTKTAYVRLGQGGS